MAESKSPKIRVLLVDDDEDDYLIIKRLFRSLDSSFSFEWEAEYEQAKRIIEGKKHDVYLIDYRLGANTGLELLTEIDAINRSEPFIILTGVGDRQVEHESVRRAAADYLVKKSLTSAELSRAIYYAIGRKEIEADKIEQLMELTRSKDEFISIASHQLRTPATTVKQYVGMLLDGMAGTLTPTQNRFLQKAYDNNERQLLIVNNLLKVAQIDAGGMKLARKDTDFSDLVEQCAKDNMSILGEHEQKMKMQIAPAVHARIDENAVRMIIDNLIENASKYSPANTQITIKVHEDASMAYASVLDHGVGVAEPSKLFQKFSRIDNERSTLVGGTGLGLYWARSVALLHGGDLTYGSNESEGSVFTLQLPKRDVTLIT